MSAVSAGRTRPAIALRGALAALVVVAGACTGDDDEVSPTTTAPTTTVPPEREQDGVLVIGAYLPRTGEGAALGEPMIAAVDEAVATVNAAGGVLGRSVRLEALDSSGGVGPTALIAEGVDAVVGPASSNEALLHLHELVRSDNPVVTCSPSATAIALDDYPDTGGYFFRTVPSDSLQMVAIHRTAQRTGVSTIAVAYLDDPYGRGLRDRLVEEIETRRPPTLITEVGFSGDEEDLSRDAALLLADDPGAVVILGDADDGGRMLAAVGAALDGVDTPPELIVNDSIRTARTTIEALPTSVRERLVVVAPIAVRSDGSGPPGFFAAHAADCVYLIALAAIQVGSDAPSRIRNVIGQVSAGGIVCGDFERCVDRLESGLRIDYDPPGDSIDLSISGDPSSGRFEVVPFAADGSEVRDELRIVDVG